MTCYILQYSGLLAPPSLMVSGDEAFDAPPRIQAQIGGVSEEIQFCVILVDVDHECEDGTVQLVCNRDDRPHIYDLLLQKNVQFLDMLAAASWWKKFSRDARDYLGFFYTTDGGTVAAAVYHSNDRIRMRVWHVDETYYSLENSIPGIISEAYDCFCEGVRLGDFVCSDGHRLVVTVDNESSVFCLFPFNEFRKLSGSIFEHYDEVLVHISNRSLLYTAVAYGRILSDLDDLTAFLQNSVVIINTYRSGSDRCLRWELSERLRPLLCLTLEVLSLVRMRCWQDMACTDVQFRWYLNPTRDELADILKQPDCRYVFADFHVDDGVNDKKEWMLSNGIRVDWQTYSPQKFNDRLAELENIQPDQYEQVEVGIDGLEFGPIMLFRAFHCTSFTPSGFKLSDFRDTIAGRLLNRGVFQVEGSYTRDYILPFLWYLLRLIYENEALWEIVECNLESEQHRRDLRDRVQEELEKAAQYEDQSTEVAT